MTGVLAGIAGLYGVGILAGSTGDALGQLSYASRVSDSYGPYTTADVDAWFPADTRAGHSSWYNHAKVGLENVLPTMLQVNTAMNLWNLGRSGGMIGLGNTLGDFYHTRRLGFIEGGTKASFFLGDLLRETGTMANYMLRGKAESPRWMDSIFGLGGENRRDPRAAGFSAPTGVYDRFVTSTNRIEQTFGKYGITGDSAKTFRQALLDKAYSTRAGITGKSSRFLHAWYQHRQGAHYEPIGKILSSSGSLSDAMERIRNPEAKRIAFRYSKSLPYARTARAMEAGTMHAVQQALGADGFAAAMKTNGAALTKDIQRFALAGTNRVRLLSAATRVARLGSALTILPALAGAAIQSTQEIIGRGIATLNTMQRMDFGGGDVIDSARLATERQRQMAAIQNSGLNARGLLGSEASYYK